MNAITRHELAQLDTPLISFSLNGREVSGRATETLLQVAKREGVEIPHLCFKEGMEAVGNCRSCMVEINGERVLAPSCCRAPTNGMKVVTDSERAVASQKLVLELLLSDMPEKEYTRNNEVDQWAAKIGVGKPRFEGAPAGAPGPDAPGHRREPGRLHPVHALHARLPDEQVNDVIGLAFRGDQAKIVFDMDDPMGRLHLRGLRRVRAGLPHRRPDAGARGGARRARQAGRLRVPRTAASAAS
jgi:formate dehydrogenase major subunit